MTHWRPALARSARNGESRMALARCENCGPPTGTKYTYTDHRAPVSHLNSGVVCGLSGCEHAPHLWLTTEEEQDYQRGQRVFKLPSSAAKVRIR
jgi:hypothetical protein